MQFVTFLFRAVEKDPISQINNVAALLCSDMSADEAQRKYPTTNAKLTLVSSLAVDKKMALAIYLKQFGQRLTSQADR